MKKIIFAFLGLLVIGTDDAFAAQRCEMQTWHYWISHGLGNNRVRGRWLLYSGVTGNTADANRNTNQDSAPAFVCGTFQDRGCATGHVVAFMDDDPLRRRDGYVRQFMRCSTHGDNDWTNFTPPQTNWCLGGARPGNGARFVAFRVENDHGVRQRGREEVYLGRHFEVHTASAFNMCRFHECPDGSTIDPTTRNCVSATQAACTAAQGQWSGGICNCRNRPDGTPHHPARDAHWRFVDGRCERQAPADEASCSRAGGFWNVAANPQCNCNLNAQGQAHSPARSGWTYRNGQCVAPPPPPGVCTLQNCQQVDSPARLWPNGGLTRANGTQCFFCGPAGGANCVNGNSQTIGDGRTFTCNAGSWTAQRSEICMPCDRVNAARGDRELRRFSNQGRQYCRVLTEFRGDAVGDDLCNTVAISYYDRQPLPSTENMRLVGEFYHCNEGFDWNRTSRTCIRSTRRVEELSGQIQRLGDPSGWRTAGGDFNWLRLGLNVAGGAVVGTAAGVLTNNVIRNRQLRDGYENIRCHSGTGNVVTFGETFVVR